MLSAEEQRRQKEAEAERVMSGGAYSTATATATAAKTIGAATIFSDGVVEVLGTESFTAKTLQQRQVPEATVIPPVAATAAAAVAVEAPAPQLRRNQSLRRTIQRTSSAENNDNRDGCGDRIDGT